MLHKDGFTHENIDLYLKELAKEYRRLNGKNMPAEIILIGGASVLINYGFRETTTDLDACINASSSMKDAINHVGDKYGLPNGWLNSDFMHTASYSPKILQFSRYYRTFSNVVTFRMVVREYLLVMKLMSFRNYKYDRSDVIGILWEHEKKGDPITLEEVKKAASDLYGSYDKLSQDARIFVETVIKNNEGYEELYFEKRNTENENKKLLKEFDEEKPGVIKADNVNDVIEALRKKKESGK